MAQTHSNHWYHVQNQLTGQPKSARHSDQWYATHQLSGFQPNSPYFGPPTVGSAPAGGPGQNVGGGGNAGGAPGPTQAEIDAAAAAEAERLRKEKEAADAKAFAEAQAREAAARDAWDRLNSQGAYDLDGWQSIGYQPDRVGMPAGWAANNWLPPTAPAPPPPPGLSSLQASYPNTNVSLLPGVSLPTGGAPTGVAVPGETAPTPGAPTNPLIQGMQRSGGTPNALTQLFGPVAPAEASAAPAAQSWNQAQALAPTAQPAQASSVWGPGAFSAQQPDAGAWGDQPGTWKKPAAQTSSWMQPKPAGQNPTLGLWGQKPPRAPGAQPWGQKPAQAGTWGAGTQWS